VGKSTVAVNLAAALANEGYQVGLIDIDIHGPNVSKMLGIEEETLLATEEEKILPVSVLPNLKAVSIANLVPPGQPVIWRGPLKNKAIDQFVNDVVWGELDFLIVDSPPGTGDEPLSLLQVAGGIDGAILVTTPQGVSTLDAQRAALFIEKMQSRLIGVVENMSYFICPHCHEKIYLFGSGGGEQLAKDLNSRLLGQIPQDAQVMSLSEQGKPFYLHMRGSNMEKAFHEIVEAILKEIEE